MKRLLRSMRSALVLSLSLALLCSALCLPVQARTLTAGDVDFDGKVTPTDARLTLRGAVGLEKLSDDALRCADVDRDTKITPADARLVLRASVKLESLKPLTSNVRAVVLLAKPIPQTTLTFPNNAAQTLGSVGENGLYLTVEPGSLTKGTKVSAVRVDNSMLGGLNLNGTTERMIFPLDFSCAGYDGAYFDTGVQLTTALSEENADYSKTDFQRFFFCYYDEAAKEVRYLTPDKIDTQRHRATISLPHFSLWWCAKLTQEEKIEQFLDRYCMQLAVAADRDKQAATELEPYLNAKAEALGLTAAAKKELVDFAVGYLRGSFVFEDEDNKYAGDYIAIGSNFTNTMIRAYFENDPEKAKSALSGAAEASLQQAWKELKFSERAGSVFKSEYIKEFVPSSVDTLISKFGAIGTVLGCIKEGDTEGALRAVGSAMEGVHPAVGFTTKAVAYIASTVNMAFTYWKANQIEELYRIYKNGARGLFGNEVLPRNRESFLTFLNASSGFTVAKGMRRFYNLDKISEVCKKYGWSFKDYASMPQKYRDIFEQRAENGLMTYFETRVKQEDAADRYKSAERENIRAMLEEDMGALKMTNYEKFFGEDLSGGYELTARMERLVRIRETLSSYVDEAKLKRDGYQNWGRLMNLWVHYASTEGTREAALEKYLKDLKEMGLLKEGLDLSLTVTLKSFYGTWTGYRSYSDSYSSGKNRYTVSVSPDLNGNTVVTRTIEIVERDGKPYTDTRPAKQTVTCKTGTYLLNGNTLTLLNKYETTGWSMKLTLLSRTSMRLTEPGSDNTEITVSLTKE